jgi:hypothetical protein
MEPGTPKQTDNVPVVDGYMVAMPISGVLAVIYLVIFVLLLVQEGIESMVDIAVVAVVFLVISAGVTAHRRIELRKVGQGHAIVGFATVMFVVWVGVVAACYAMQHFFNTFTFALNL